MIRCQYKSWVCGWVYGFISQAHIGVSVTVCKICLDKDPVSIPGKVNAQRNGNLVVTFCKLLCAN